MLVLKFYADWCMPCKAITPALMNLCESNDVDLQNINVETNADEARKYDVRGIPTLVLLNSELNEVGRTNRVDVLAKLIKENS